jgi:hypothetical protein
MPTLSESAWGEGFPESPISTGVLRYSYVYTLVVTPPSIILGSFSW